MLIFELTFFNQNRQKVKLLETQSDRMDIRDTKSPYLTLILHIFKV